MRNIIIASNNQELHHLLSSFLAQAGYSHVYSSTDSKETFSLTYRYNPKLIIIDLELPSCELTDIFKFQVLSAGLCSLWPLIVRWMKLFWD